MDLKTIALAFGLQDSATEADVLALANGLRQKDATISELNTQLESLKLAGITTKVDAAIAEGKLSASEKQEMIELGKMDAGKLDKVLSLLSKPLKPTEIIGGAAGAGGAEGSMDLTKAIKLSDVPQEQWAGLKEKNIALYKKLYKGEYGIECMF